MGAPWTFSDLDLAGTTHTNGRGLRGRPVDVHRHERQLQRCPGAVTDSIAVGAAAAGNYATIVGISPVVADGVASSTITITLRDSTPTRSAASSRRSRRPARQHHGACSADSASGVSTCHSVDQGRDQDLSIATPVSVTGGSVTFVAGAPNKLVFLSSRPALVNDIISRT